MNRSEADLRAVYTDPPGIDAVERRLIDSLLHQRPIHQRPPHQRLNTSTSGRKPVATWAAIGGGVAAVAAVTLTVVVGIGHLHSPNSVQPGAAATAPPAVTAPATTATAAVSPAPSTVTITPQVAVQTLIDLLPGQGTTSQLTGRASLGWAGGELVYDDGHGAAQLAVGVSYPYSYNGSDQRLAAGSLCSSQGVTQLHEVCTSLPDGSQVAVYQGDANIPNGAKDWEVSLLRADGVQIDITEWNSPAEKAGAQTRTNPPFTIAELTTVAESSTWQATTSPATVQQDAGLFVPDPSIRTN
jgi:hypothetical protein